MVSRTLFVVLVSLFACSLISLGECVDEPERHTALKDTALKGAENGDLLAEDIRGATGAELEAGNEVDFGMYDESDVGSNSDGTSKIDEQIRSDEETARAELRSEYAVDDDEIMTRSDGYKGVILPDGRLAGPWSFRRKAADEKDDRERARKALDDFSMRIQKLVKLDSDIGGPVLLKDGTVLGEVEDGIDTEN